MIQWIKSHYNTKVVCRNAPIFSRDRSKRGPLLQMERGYYENRPAPENAFLGAGHPLTRP